MRNNILNTMDNVTVTALHFRPAISISNQIQLKK